MKPSDDLPRLFDLRVAELPLYDEVLKELTLFKSPHLDQVFQYHILGAQFPKRREPQLPPAFHDRQHSQVEILRVARIETNLLLAKMSTPLQGREIDEVEFHRALEFEGVFSKEKNMGDMSMKVFWRFLLARSDRRIGLSLPQKIQNPDLRIQIFFHRYNNQL